MTSSPAINRAIDPRHDPGLSLESFQAIDRKCQSFEGALRAKRPAKIEEFLADNGDSDFLPLFRELLAIEIEHRMVRGDELDRLEYCERFPNHVSIVEFVFEEAANNATDPRDHARPAVSDGARADAIPEFLTAHPRYRVLKLLGRGGMGTVYLARHVVLDRDVALKVIRPELIARADIVERFQSEAKAAARLNHPNIVAVFDADAAGGQHFLVMEYIAGDDLSRVVRERGPLAVEQAVDYIRQAAEGLQHAHEQGMVHRDITPRNLMLSTGGRIKVLDFGLAQLMQNSGAADIRNPSAANSATADTVRETSGMLLGSVDFMAPEQAADPDSADIRADIYSLGCTLCFLLTGRPPFSGAAPQERLRRHAEEALPGLDHIRPDVPPQLACLVARMMSKDPADRFDAPADVALALKPWRQCAERISDAIPNTGNSVRHPKSRRRTVQFIAATSMMVCLALGAIGLRAQFATWSATGETIESPEARRLYREGLRLLSERKEQQVHAAIPRLKKAVELAPRFARAQTALADAYNLCGDYGWDRPDDVFPQAESTARRAIAQEPNLAEAHLALAFSRHAYQCDFVTAELEYRRAIELNPRLASAHHWYAWFLAERGRHREAAVEIQHARDLAPEDLIIVNNVGRLLFLAGDFRGAAAQHKYALELDPDFRKAHRDLALAYGELGQLADALAELEQSRGLSDDASDVLAAKAYLLARNSRADEARSLLPEIEKLSKRRPLDYEIATIRSALGDIGPALAALEGAVRSRSAARAGMGVDSRLAAVRTDPRCQAILSRITISAGTKDRAAAPREVD